MKNVLLAAGLAALVVTAGAGEAATPEAVRIAKDDALKAEVFALRDAEMTRATKDLEGVLLGITPEEIAALVPDETVSLSNQAFLVKWDGKNILVDAGSGQAAGGVMLESLALAGVKPEDVEAVLITHLHFDHVGGIEYEGTAVFPNATIYLKEEELGAWTTDEGIAKLPNDKKEWAEIAKKALAPYADRVIGLKSSSGRRGHVAYQDDFPLGWIALVGHTPGHIAYTLADIESGKTVIAFIGDTVHIAEVQLPRPQTTIVYDSDPDAARETRRMAFEEFPKGDMPLAGAHLPFPGAGTLEREGDGYRFIPVDPLP